MAKIGNLQEEITRYEPIVTAAFKTYCEGLKAEDPEHYNAAMALMGIAALGSEDRLLAIKFGTIGALFTEINEEMRFDELLKNL